MRSSPVSNPNLASFSLGDVLANGKQRFNALLDGYKSLFGNEHSPLSRACLYALEGEGKRFRPAIVYAMAEANGRAGPGADCAAAAVEFFHTASLIADDLPCMDNDDLRRGRPTVHKVFGESVALLASYALIAEGYAMIGRAMKLSGVPDALGPALENAAYNTGALGATGGQFSDLFPTEGSIDAVLEALNKKTATLFEVAFVLGWLVSGGGVPFIEKVRKAAYHFGVAFQIADDLSDADEDAAAGRAVNLAVAAGSGGAKIALKQQIQLFKEALSGLGIQCEPLGRLVESLLI
jgi:geranylgeranyl diphosphate synthase type II